MKNRGVKRIRNKRRRSKRRTNRISITKKIIWCLCGALLMLFVAMAVYAIAQLGKIKTDNIREEDIVVNVREEETGEGYTTFAVFGVDAREGELGQGVRSDTIIIVSLNNRTKEVRMASVFRDTLLDLSNGELEKCNAAYSYGGPTQAINMLNMNLDLDIKDYVTVDFSVVTSVVDAVGGVYIDVKEDEIDEINRYIGETAKVAQKVPKRITEPGRQLLNGVQATTYSRVRHTEGGDFKRTERQRNVIDQIAIRIKGADLVALNRIVNALFPRVSTSFSITEVLSYAKDYRKYEIGETMGFPEDNTTATLEGKGSVVLPNSLVQSVEKLHSFLYEDEAYSSSSEVESISRAIRKEANNMQD